MIPRGRNYEVTVQRSNELTEHSLAISKDIDKIVHKQTVLDALIELLSDKTVFNKVRRIIKNKK